MDVRTRLPGAEFCFDSHEGELPSIRVEHPEFSASLLFQGGQLIRFRPHGTADWLWLSDEEPFLAGRAVRGGIPICWPWFGAPSRNPDNVRRRISSDKAHGFARLADWQLEAIEETPASVTIILKLDSTTLRNTGWSGQGSVAARFYMTPAGLEVSVETTNTGTESFALTQALHSYFPTADIHRTAILGLDGESYVDALANWQVCEQRGPVVFKGETDRLYQVSGPLQLATPDARWHLNSAGSRSAVIWNPWIEKSRGLSHFASAAWQKMFCVETANVLDDAITLAPGAAHRMGFSLSIAGGEPA